MHTTSTVFQSLRGFHPCSYELFLKLKHLHKCYWQTVYDFHRWHRWLRKQPQHRIGPEPTCCPSFINDLAWYKPVRIHGMHQIKRYPKTVIDHGIVGLYHSARKPQAEPVPLIELETQTRIELLYETVKGYFDK
jgi:hypothetical protein